MLSPRRLALETLAKLGLAFLLGLSLLTATRSARANDMNSDLPPVGISLFDLYRTARGGLPDSFEELRQSLHQSGSMQARQDTALLIPFGRSLQKPLSLSPSPLAFPRIVLSVSNELRTKSVQRTPGPLLTNNRIFVGFHEPKEQLEVISWNEWAGRFEFQIVRDFAPGKKAKVFYAPRALCLSCHQGAGPIFPVAPWAELNAEINSAALIRKARTLHGDPTNFYLGVKIQDEEEGRQNFPETRKGQAQIFENSVQRAQTLLRSQKFWGAFCDATTAASDCRRQLLLGGALFDLAGIPNENLQGVLKTSPHKISKELLEIFRHEDVILDARSPIFELVKAMNKRIPFSLEGAQNLVESIFEVLGQAARSTGNVLQEIEHRFLTMKLPEKEDPQSRRTGASLGNLRDLQAGAFHSVGASIFEENRAEFLARYGSPSATVRDAVNGFTISLSSNELSEVRVPEVEGQRFSFNLAPPLSLQRKELSNRDFHFFLADDEDTETLAPNLQRIEIYRDEPFMGYVLYHAILQLRGGKTLSDYQCLEIGTQLQCRQLKFDALLEAMESLPKEFFEEKVLGQRLLLSRLLDLPTPDLDYLLQAAEEPKLLEPEALTEILPKITHHRLKATLESCGRCHYGEDSAGPTLFVGQSDFELFESLRKNSATMLERLTAERKPMPPQKSVEAQLMGADQRQELASFLEELSISESR